MPAVWARVDAVQALGSGKLAEQFEKDRTEVEQAAGEASWQMGKVERVGRWCGGAAWLGARSSREAREGWVVSRG